MTPPRARGERRGPRGRGERGGSVPSVPAAWKPCAERLVQAARSFGREPPWWGPSVGFFGTIESHAPGSAYYWDGVERAESGDPPFFACQLTLAGRGHFEHGDESPRAVTPGDAFFVTIPSRHRYYLPEDSPGWIFCWVSVFHAYVIERARRLIETSGPVLEAQPQSDLVGCMMRLVRGTFRKDFRDPFELELALFELLMAYERLALLAGDPEGEAHRLLEAVRRRVLRDLRRPFGVEALAAEHGMSRSHFSHFFRARTGLTPARFITQTRVREAARLMVETRAPLGQIAEACGFADANHFGKVFRRIHQQSPGAYRRARSGTVSR